MDKKRKHILNKYDKNLKSFEYKSSFYTASALARPRARHTSPIYTANAYRQTTDKLIFKSVISTVR